MTLTRQTRRRVVASSYNSDYRDDSLANDAVGWPPVECCATTPTTSAASAHHRMRGAHVNDTAQTAATTSTPMIDNNGASPCRRRLIIQRISPIRRSAGNEVSPQRAYDSGIIDTTISRNSSGSSSSSSSGNNSVVILSAQRATRNYQAQLHNDNKKVSKIRDSLNSSSELLSWHDTNTSNNSSYNNGTMYCGANSVDAWPSVLEVLETPERKRLKAADSEPSGGPTSSIFGSPPLRRNALEIMKSPPVLRTPKASLRSANVHISSSPMSAFFCRRASGGVSGRAARSVLASNENFATGGMTKEQKKFLEMRFCGSQFTRPTETTCSSSLPVRQTCGTDNVTRENDVAIVAGGYDAHYCVLPPTTQVADDSQLSEDSGISTFFQPTADSPETATGSSTIDGTLKLARADGFSVPQTCGSGLAIEFVDRYGQVNIETPSKGLATEIGDSILAGADASRLFALNTTPYKQRALLSPTRVIAGRCSAPEMASGPLEAELFTAMLRHYSLRFSPRKNRQRRGILRRRREPTSRITGYEKFDGRNLLSARQIEFFKGNHNELVAVYDFFAINRARLVGETPDQIEVTTLARAYYQANRARYAPAVLQELLERERSLVFAGYTLSAGLSPLPSLSLSSPL